MHGSWEQARSHFNHGWLKNQFIAVLLKCRQVQQRTVLNDSAQQDLQARLAQWPDERRAADAVVAEVQAAVEQELRDEIDVSVDTRVVRLANELERRRWISALDPCSAAAAARVAIDELDASINHALQVMRPSTEPTSIGIDGDTLGCLLDSAQRASEAFSRLTLCHSISEPA